MNFLPKGDRIYPQNPLAALIVRMLDRLPDSIRTAVLESYWSAADVELIRLRAHMKYAGLMGCCEWFRVKEDGSFECCGLKAEYTTCNNSLVVCQKHKCQCSQLLN